MQDKKKFRIAYLSGLADAAKVYESWLASRRSGIFDTQREFFGTVYMSQFFEVCAENDADVYVITTRPTNYDVQRRGNVLIENRPEPSKTLRGGLYHLAVVFWLVRWIPHLIRFKPDVVIVTAFQNHWFLLSFFHWIGIRTIASIHNGFWPKVGPVRLSLRLLSLLNRFFFKYAKVALAVSDDAGEQARSLAGKSDIQILTFDATYPRDQFSEIQPANINTAPPFRVLFIGRVEKNKGVFDLLNIATRLDRERSGDFRFDICGDGSDFERLRDQVKKLLLEDKVFCHGWCDAAAIQSLMARSHAVVIPTTTDFDEGFPKVYAEAILSGRPVITSTICITKAGVEAAAIEVRSNDVDGYYRAIQRLFDDRELFEEKRQACFPLQDRFYDNNNSYGSKLRKAIELCRTPRGLHQ